LWAALPQVVEGLHQLWKPVKFPAFAMGDVTGLFSYDRVGLDGSAAEVGKFGVVLCKQVGGELLVVRSWSLGLPGWCQGRGHLAQQDAECSGWCDVGE